MNNRGWLSWSQAQSMVPKIASSIDWLAMNGQVATQRRGRVDWFRQAAVYQVTEKLRQGELARRLLEIADQYDAYLSSLQSQSSFAQRGDR